MKKLLPFIFLLSVLDGQRATASNMFCIPNPRSPSYVSISPAQRLCNENCKPYVGVLVYSLDSKAFSGISDDFVELCLRRNKIGCSCRK